LCRANGVCFLTDATRLFVVKDAVRLRSTNACRLLPTNPEFLLTTEDCAQAASDAAVRATANSRMTFRTPAAEAEDASGT
jgi:hypothetical protein